MFSSHSGDQGDDLVEPCLRSQRLRHGFAQLLQEHARPADRCRHRLRPAAPGRKAARGRRVTGLLVDYHLDRGDGLSAIGALRGRFGRDIPAILITADRSRQVRDKARLSEIVVLNKPIKPASLRALVGQWRTRQMDAAE